MSKQTKKHSKTFKKQEITMTTALPCSTPLLPTLPTLLYWLLLALVRLRLALNDLNSLFVLVFMLSVLVLLSSLLLVLVLLSSLLLLSLLLLLLFSLSAVLSSPLVRFLRRALVGRAALAV